MASEFGESMRLSCSGNCSSDVGNFECNICFEVAQDPIVTLCGHLYCWPCLYRWLHVHSHCQECPVCKALIQEDKLVPLFGRGKTSFDPRSSSSSVVTGSHIPNRPIGQRPETAPPAPPHANYFRQDSFGPVGGQVPPPASSAPLARVGNLTLSTAFGGLMQSLNLHVHGFHDATVYGATTGFPYGFSSSDHWGHAHGVHHPRPNQEQRRNSYLKLWFFVVGFAVVLALLSL